MATVLKKVWQVLRTDVRELLAPTEVAESGTEISKAALELGIALGLLVNPQFAIAAAGLSFVGLGVKGIKAYRDKYHKEPGLEECVAIAAPLAYLKSLSDLEQNNLRLRQVLERGARENSQVELTNLGEFQLDEQLARNALSCFHRSELGQAFNRALAAQLESAGMEKTEAEIICAWVAWGTQRYLPQMLETAGEEVRKIAGLYASREPDDEASRQYRSIERYLQEQIATKLQEKVFDETFTFQQVYVPLEVKPVNKDGEPDRNSAAINIEEWAKGLLLNETLHKKVLFIQGGPGRGKSVFCRMFADWVRQELHPIYTPILIRLRDIKAAENDFDTTLKQATGTDFVNDSGWLTNRNTRFLFLLDGFDELLLERGANANLRQFLEQVEAFQRRCSNASERQHRVLITGRPLALFGIERFMPTDLERVEIIPMTEIIQDCWLEKWQTVVGGDADTAAGKTAAFRGFLRGEHCPESVQILAKEPLLLYLLAAMHRDGQIEAEQFASAAGSKAKVWIYQQALEWVLNKQREKNLNQQLTDLEAEDLRAILAEAGLCVVQSGQERARVATIEDRLVERGDEDIKKQIEAARRQSKEDGLKNALAVFYLKSVPGADNCVEFFHKSFGEFLCAERMVESLADWAEMETDRRGRIKPRIAEAEFDGQVYDLFGYGALTAEIVEYVRALLEQAELDVVVLFQRLNEFYQRWSEGEFIEATTDTLPQKKARQLQTHGIERGQRQVDIYTGLNVLILLLELHRHGQEQEALKEKIIFHPCGQKESEYFYSQGLLQIIGYSQCLGVDSFRDIVGLFLWGANLSGANLWGANLSGADLSGANLSGADLSGADLSGANLSGANLSRTYLSGVDLSGTNLIRADLIGADLSRTYLSGVNLNGANLSGANLIGADLSGANLIGADLSRTYLSGVNLIGADLSGAILEGAEWNSSTQWFDARGLDEAINVSDELAREPPFAAALRLNQGVSCVRQGNVDAALAAYQEAQTLNPNLEISASFWNDLCWYGSLYDRAADVLFAGEKAVELEPNNRSYRDSRGLARALTGDIPGAIEDFQAVLDSVFFGEEDQQQRQRWLDALRAGENPFTPEELAALRSS